MARAERKLTGWHVLAIFVGAFGIIIGVNVALAWNAIATFPGLEVENGYIASQTFDDRREAQEALGWTSSASYDRGQLVLTLNDAQGFPVRPAELMVKLGRATNVKEDRIPDLEFTGRDWIAPENLGYGHWTVWVSANAADGTLFEQRLELFVKDK